MTTGTRQSRDHADVARLHDAVAIRLKAAGQRYTGSRRELVETLAASGRPLTMAEILEHSPSLPKSTAYRHLSILATSGVIHRLAANEDAAFFELTDELSGHHHHHVLCEACGKVVDIGSSPELERALTKAAALAAAETGFDLDGHRIDLVGTCADCQKS